MEDVKDPNLAAIKAATNFCGAKNKWKMQELDEFKDQLEKFIRLIGDSGLNGTDLHSVLDVFYLGHMVSAKVSASGTRVGGLKFLETTRGIRGARQNMELPSLLYAIATAQCGDIREFINKFSVFLTQKQLEKADDQNLFISAVWKTAENKTQQNRDTSARLWAGVGGTQELKQKYEQVCTISEAARVVDLLQQLNATEAYHVLRFLYLMHYISKEPIQSAFYAGASSVGSKPSSRKPDRSKPSLLDYVLRTYCGPSADGKTSDLTHIRAFLTGLMFPNQSQRDANQARKYPGGWNQPTFSSAYERPVKVEHKPQVQASPKDQKFGPEAKASATTSFDRTKAEKRIRNDRETETRVPKMPAAGAKPEASLSAANQAAILAMIQKLEQQQSK